MEMGVTMEIEIGEVCDCLRGTAWQYVAAPHEAAKALCHLDIHQVR